MASSVAAKPFTATLFALLDETFDDIHEHFFIWRETGALTPAEWREIRSELRTGHNHIKTLIAEAPDWDGEMDMDGAIAVAVCTAYHLGELRQALCTIRPHTTRSEASGFQSLR